MDPLPILLHLYGATWRLATPLLRRHKRLSAGFEERLVPDGWPFAGGEPPSGPVIWVQAASGGEAKLVHSLVRALGELLASVGGDTPPAPVCVGTPSPSPAQGSTRSSSADHPPLTLLCTTCTAQGLEVLQAIPAEPSPHLRVLPRFFPLDRPDFMERAMRQTGPAGVVLLETELWPGLLVAAAEAEVPVFVYNARMTAKSAAGYAWLRSFWKKYAPRRVLATAEADAGRFADLFGEERVELMRNIKFDGAAAALRRTAAGEQEGGDVARNETALRLAMAVPPPGPDALLTAFASVREQEEPLLLPVLRRLREAAPCVHVVVAPRHLTRIPHWQAYAKELGVPVALRSTLMEDAAREKGADRQEDPALRNNGATASSNADAAPATGGPRLILWDTFGDLHALYAMTDAAFVGGSLAPLGGQNFLEALEAGLIPCIGPHWDNFLWVGNTLMEEGLVRVCPGPDELAAALEHTCAALKAQPPGAWQEQRAAAKTLVRRRFSQWLTARTGGSRQAAQALLTDTGLCPNLAG